MANRYFVTNLGNESTVTDTLSGEIVFIGPYLRAVSQADELNRQSLAFYNQATTVVSSGNIIQEEQKAKADHSNTGAPQPSGRIIYPADPNADPGKIESLPTIVTEDGQRIPYIEISRNSPPGSGDVVTTTQSQSTPPGGPNSQTTGATGATPVVIPGIQAGVGAPSDDSGTDQGEIVITAPRLSGSNDVVTSLNSIKWDDQIQDQPNVLDQYASYSYQASLYLIDKSNAERILNTGSKNLGNAKLLVQSGGIAPETRNEFFSLDYYIDHIDLHSFFAGKSVRLAHNVKEVKMTIVEPNGISFLQNLDAAVQQYIGASTNGSATQADVRAVDNAIDLTGAPPPIKKKNFASQIYLLVIKFYGYDEQGNLIVGGRKNNGTSDPNAVVEKFYPLIITKLGFRITNKAVEYDIQAKAPPYYINASQGRGTIPFNYEFSGQTIKDILAGPAVYAAGQTAVSAGSNSPTVETRETYEVEYQSDPATGVAVPVLIARPTISSTVSPPAKANAITPKTKTLRLGLMAALNDYQEELRQKKVIEFKDEYNVEFVLDSIASATVVQPGLNKSGTSMATPGTAADQKLGAKQNMDPKTQIEGIVAGTQIVQFIDQILRRSSYIRDQQTQIVNNKTGVVTPGPGANLKDTSWYKIGFKAVPKLDQYDRKRNDYAYKITYTIAPYRISQLNSPYFKQPRYAGVHKSYNYWFTGQNTQVLNYEETLNSLYYIALTNSNLAGATSSINGALALNELQKYAPSTASGQATQGGGTDKTLEPSANAADQLYSPSDLKECNITIVGDPAWLQQGEAFSALSKNSPYYFNAFLPDGTINFDAQQILFSIGFNAPRDYNTLTGVMQPSADKLNSTTQFNQTTQTPNTSQFSRIYIAKECISSFNKGKFTQNIKGSLMVYYPPDNTQGRPSPATTNTASSQAAPAVTPAPTVRIGSQDFPVKVPELNPANRPLLNVGQRPLPANLQPPPIPQRTPLPLESTSVAPGSINPVTLLPNPNPPQVMNREP